MKVFAVWFFSQRAFPGRLACHFLLGAFAILAIFLLATSYGFKCVLGEDGPAEMTQAALLALISLGTLLLAVRDPAHRLAYGAVFAVGLLALLRELNHLEFYRAALARTGVKPALATALGLALILGWRTRAGLQLRRQLGALASCPAFALAVAGGLLVLAAQILERKNLRRVLLGTSTLDMRHVIEEGLELAGYLLILSWVAEEHLRLLTRSAKTAPERSAPVSSLSVTPEPPLAVGCMARD